MLDCLTGWRLTLKKTFGIIAAIALCALAPQLAQNFMANAEEKMDHSKMGHAMPADATPATLAFKKAMDGMMQEMDIGYSGNADVDFVKGMIPHHQGAVEMAKVILQYGKDTELRTLAEGIVKAQESEIAFMQEWLKKNGPK